VVIGGHLSRPSDSVRHTPLIVGTSWSILPQINAEAGLDCVHSRRQVASLSQVHDWVVLEPSPLGRSRIICRGDRVPPLTLLSDQTFNVTARCPRITEMIPRTPDRNFLNLLSSRQTADYPPRGSRPSSHAVVGSDLQHGHPMPENHRDNPHVDQVEILNLLSSRQIAEYLPRGSRPPRTLSSDQTFNMTKHDVAALPAGG
jgi:hypothetical protein